MNFRLIILLAALCCGHVFAQPEFIVHVIENEDETHSVQLSPFAEGVSHELARFLHLFQHSLWTDGRAHWYVILTKSPKVTVHIHDVKHEFVIDEKEFATRQTKVRHIRQFNEANKANKTKKALVTIIDPNKLKTSEQRFRFVLESLGGDAPFAIDWEELKERRYFLGASRYENFIRAELLSDYVNAFLTHERHSPSQQRWLGDARKIKAEATKIMATLGRTKKETVIPLRVISQAQPSAYQEAAQDILTRIILPLVQRAHVSRNWEGLYRWEERPRSLLLFKSVEISFTDRPLNLVGKTHCGTALDYDCHPFAIQISRREKQVVLQVTFSSQELAKTESGEIRADIIQQTLAAFSRAVAGPIENFLRIPLQHLLQHPDMDEIMLGHRVDETARAAEIIRHIDHNQSIWPQFMDLRMGRALQYQIERLDGLSGLYANCSTALAGDMTATVNRYLRRYGRRSTPPR